MSNDILSIAGTAIVGDLASETRSVCYNLSTMPFIGFLVAIIAQVFNGTVSVFDKFLLQRTLKPTVFAFWISLTSLSAFILLPFGFQIPVGNQWFLDLAAGATFVLAVIFLYEALQKEELTRVVPIIGALTPIFTLIIAYFFLGEILTSNQFIAVLILILGVFLLTYRHSPKPSNWLILVCAILAAFGFALSSVLMKEVFNQQPFIAGLAWSRLGGLIIIPIVLFDRVSREEIFKKRELPKKGNIIIFGVGRIFSASGFVLINLAYAILNPAIVNALAGVQYAYLFVAGLMLGKFWPQLFSEKLERRYLFSKIAGLVIIIIGTVILSWAS